MPSRPTSGPSWRPRRLFAAVVFALVLLPQAAQALPVDPYAPYQPQTTCTKTAQPGTVKLANWLLKTYPASTNMGMMRACAGGASEHKDGRAFDWGNNIGSATDRADVASFFSRIFATDADGNANALARRMGIMYLIWNDKIYSSYYQFRARDYLDPSCSSTAACSATLRHRNHVHISLSRAGGAGTTSWYASSTTVPPTIPPTTPPPTAPGTLDLTTTPYARVVVPADAHRLRTGFTLTAGVTYKLSTGGVYRWGRPAQLADAVCVKTGARQPWRSYPPRWLSSARGSMNLDVNGQRGFGPGCHPRTHRYATTITPTSTGPLRLRVVNRGGSSAASLVLVVSAPATDVSAALRRR